MLLKHSQTYRYKRIFKYILSFMIFALVYEFIRGGDFSHIFWILIAAMGIGKYVGIIQEQILDKYHSCPIYF